MKTCPVKIALSENGKPLYLPINASKKTHTQIKKKHNSEAFFPPIIHSYPTTQSFQIR